MVTCCGHCLIVLGASRFNILMNWIKLLQGSERSASKRFNEEYESGVYSFTNSLFSLGYLSREDQLTICCMFFVWYILCLGCCHGRPVILLFWVDASIWSWIFHFPTMADFQLPRKGLTKYLFQLFNFISKLQLFIHLVQELWLCHFVLLWYCCHTVNRTLVQTEEEPIRLDQWSL